MTDMEVLRRAYERENDSRDNRPQMLRSWEAYSVGASRGDINRLLDEGMIIIAMKADGFTRYKLSEKGRGFVAAMSMERVQRRIPATDLLSAMSLVVGWEDLKASIAMTIERRRRTNFLLEGPPACGKSLIIEGVRSAVPTAYIAFGSRTSASGLSQALFENQPSVLLMDEADKMHHDCYSVMLGLMEGGEILETKSQKTRGVKLETMVIAACNSSEKMPPEFLSRFALHAKFPAYSREEFIEVCVGFLTRVEGCPAEIARLLGQLVYDYGLGDVRKARGAWQLMISPTDDEVHRVIHLMMKYSPGAARTRKQPVPERRLI